MTKFKVLETPHYFRDKNMERFGLECSDGINQKNIHNLPEVGGKMFLVKNNHDDVFGSYAGWVFTSDYGWVISREIWGFDVYVPYISLDEYQSVVGTRAYKKLKKTNYVDFYYWELWLVFRDTERRSWFGAKKMLARLKERIAKK